MNRPGLLFDRNREHGEGQGIGTATLRKLKDKARRKDKTLTLNVMKNNRSRALYERLGFRVIGQTNH
jgi:ribosomal protein S18 acetylase RimI-like enzyme